MLRSEIHAFILANRRSGKRGCFMWDDNGLYAYINWAFSRNCLFHVSDKNSTIAVGVAYPLPNKFNGTIESLLPYDDELQSEDDKDLVIMDWLTINSDGRNTLVKQFKERFKNWENQDKYGLHYSKPKKLSNNYINKLIY